MRPQAKPFSPFPSALSRGGSVDAEGDGGEVRSAARHKPIAFDGRSSWEAYSTQFEMLAKLNRWSSDEKAAHLAVSLRGSADESVGGAATELHGTGSGRFGTGHQTELNRAKLRTRVQRREEVLPALAEDVERLTRLAYPDALEGMITTLAKDQFIDALQDGDTRLRIRQLRPPTLQRALELALEMESCNLAGRQRGPAVREVRVEATGRRRPPSSTSQGKVLEKLQECLQALQQQ